MATNEIIDARKAEVAQYEANIKVYTAIADALPSEWPDRLIALKGSTNRHADIATISDLKDVALVGDLWAHDDAEAAIRSETVELRKSKAILDAISK